MSSAPISRDTRERAAVFCSMLACDRAANDWRAKLYARPVKGIHGGVLDAVAWGIGSEQYQPTLPQHVAFRAWKRATRVWPEWTVAERWAEAEAMLRSYEVR